jgi:hypothetical protein
MGNLEDLSKKIEASIPRLQAASANAEVVANNEALGTILGRIFNDGQKTNGSKIGSYTSESYKRKRESAGLQTNQIDLQFEGDLFNSVQVGTLNGRPAVGIINSDEAEISGHLEERYGPIFQASLSEREQAISTARDFMFNAIRKEIKTWS